MSKDDCTVEALAEAAAAAAMRASVSYVKKQGTARPDLDTWTAALRKHVKDALPAALEDAKAALECGMSSAAEQTFTASMVLAGIAAAKEALGQTA